MCKCYKKYINKQILLTSSCNTLYPHMCNMLQLKTTTLFHIVIFINIPTLATTTETIELLSEEGGSDIQDISTVEFTVWFNGDRMTGSD